MILIVYEKIQVYEYDCVLLLLCLMGLDLINIKIYKKTGIIIISAKNSFDDKIDGLNLS
jgi:DNA-binding response OmpR family regulator